MTELAKAAPKRTLGLARALLILAILWLGYGLRLYRLDAESIWFDEGGSLALAAASLPELLAEARAPLQPEPHPPFYYVALKGWLALTGSSDYSLRSFSLAPGMLALPLFFALVTRLTQPQVGLLCLWLMACSPFFVFYSQEGRMYTLVTALLLFSSWAALRVATQGKGHLAYALFTFLALHTHYFALLVIGVQVVAVALVVPKDRARWLWWQLPWLALSLPWALYRFWGFSGLGEFWRQFYSLDFIVLDAIDNFSLGEREDETKTVLFVVFYLLLLLALVGLRREESRGVTLLALASLGFAFLANAFSPLPIYVPRYLIVVAPAYLLLLALGLWNVARWGWRSWLAGAASVALVAGVAFNYAQGLVAHYATVGEFREDYRSLARYLQPLAQPDDGMIFLAGRMDRALFHYLEGSFPTLTLDQSHQYTEETQLPELGRLAGDPGVRRVWLVESILFSYTNLDPAGLVPGTIAEVRGPPLLERGFRGLLVRLYGSPPW